MEWRIILPVVCVLGILFVPTSASTNGTVTNATATNMTGTNATATNATVTNATSTNVITTNATATNATATNATVTNATSTNVIATNATATNATATNATVTNASATNPTVTNATGTNAIATNATVTNATATNATSTNATATNPTATNATTTNTTVTIATATNSTSANSTATNVTTTNATAINTTSTNKPASNGTITNPTNSAVTELNITYSVNQLFKEEYTNLSHPETISLINNLTSQIESVYKKRFTNFRRYVIRKFSKGSIVTEGSLEFSDNGTVPKAQDVVKVIIDAAKAGSFNLPIDKQSVSASDSSGVPVTPLFNTSQINVTFSIIDTFTEALFNLNSTEAKNLTDKITTQFVTVFKRRYANILRMVIRKFSKGSIVTEGSLEFSDLDTVPKAQDVVNVIIDAAKAGSFNLPIDKQSVSASDSSGVPVTPLFNTSQINVTFSLTDTFNDSLTNLNSTEAKNLTDKITTQFVTVFKRRYANILRMVIRKFSKGSIVTEGSLEFSDLDTVPKAQDVVNVIIDAAKAGSFNLPIDKQSVSASDSSGVPVTPLFNTSQINVTFSIIDTFNDSLTNLNSTEAKNLTDKITTQFVTVFKRRYSNILRMIIRKFSKGSIVTEGSLEFSDLDTVPKAQDVVNVIIDAAKAGSFNLSIDKQTVSASDSSGNSAKPLFNTSQINVTFSLTDTFNDSLNNLNSTEAKNLTDKITTQFVTVFKRRYSNILRMVIRKFSKGSIVTEGSLEFSDLETVPKAQDVVNVIIDAAKAGSFNLSIDKTTVNATDSSGNSATPLFKTSEINVTFSIIDTFTDALSNLSSPAAKNLTEKITTQFVAVFKRRYANILRMVIRKFRKGSIVPDCALQFSDLDTVPKAQDVVNVIVDAVKAGNFSFPVDEKSITASDSSGSVTSHGISSVISSMFTVLCMALASLLLSGVMHQ